MTLYTSAGGSGAVGKRPIGALREHAASRGVSVAMLASRVAPPLLAFVALADCAGSRPAPTSERALHATAPDASTPARVVLVPSLDRVVTVSRDRSLVRGEIGAVRVELRRDRVDVALVGFAEGAASTFPIRDGWAFRGERSELAVSDAFLGELHRVGHAGGERTMAQCDGRAAVVSADGLLRSTTGRPAATLLPAQPNATVLDAYFRDERAGIALLLGGSLAFTRDAGATWEPYPLQGAAYLIGQLNDGFYVHTAAGPVAFDRDGAPQPLHFRKPANAPPARLSDDEIERAQLAIFAREPAYALAAASAALPTGVAVVRAHEALRAISAVTGDRMWDATLPDAQCEVFAWGATIAARCPRGEKRALYRLNDEHAFEHAADLPEPGAGDEVAFADDGRSALALGACGAPADDVAISACALDPGVRSWRFLTRVPRYARALAAAGGRALLAWDSDSQSRGIFLLDLRDGSVRPVPYVENAVAASARVHARLTADGAVFGEVLPRYDEHGAVLTGSVDGLSVRALPGEWQPARRSSRRWRGAFAAGMANATHGIAVGATPDELWRTLDGARTWERLPVPLDRPMPPVERVPDPLDVRCVAQGCVTTNGVAVIGWSDLAPPGPGFLAPEPLSWHVAPLPGLPRFGCTIEPDTTRSDRLADQDRGVVLDDERDGIRARIVLARRPTGVGVTAEWSGVAGGRAFHATVSTDRDDRPDEWRLLAATPSQLLLALETAPGTWTIETLDEIGFLRVEGRAEFESEIPNAPMVEDAVATSDGSLLARVFVPTFEHLAVDGVFRTGVHGVTSRPRTFTALRDDPARGLARHRGRWGYVLADPRTGSLRFFPYDGHADEDLGPMPEAPIAVCTEPAREDATLLRVTRHPDGGYDPAHLGVVELELAGGRFCIRAMRDLPGPLQRPGSEGIIESMSELQADADGALTGSAIMIAFQSRPRSFARLRCVAR